MAKISMAKIDQAAQKTDVNFGEKTTALSLE